MARVGLLLVLTDPMRSNPLNYDSVRHEHPNHHYSSYPALRLVQSLHRFGKAKRGIKHLSAFQDKPKTRAQSNRLHCLPAQCCAGVSELSIVMSGWFRLCFLIFFSLGGGPGECCLPVPALSISISVVSILPGCTASMFCQRSTNFFSMSLSREKSFHQI